MIYVHHINGIIEGIYSDENNIPIPQEVIEITKEQHKALISKGFDFYKIVNGNLISDATFEDRLKDRKAELISHVSEVERAMFKFLVKQINNIRTGAGLLPLTAAQIKAGVKSEL